MSANANANVEGEWTAEELREFEECVSSKSWRMRHLYQILPEEGAVMVPFELRPEQAQFMLGRHTRNFVPKARKLGMSTFIVLDYLDTCIFTPNTLCAHIDKKEADAKDKLHIARMAWEAGPRHPDPALAEHITAGGVVQMAFATNPDPVVWVVTGTGQLLSMTFERDQSVVGWSRHITDGQVESVAVIYSAPGQADEIWAVVRRHIVDASGVAQTRRYIERLDPAKWSKIEAGDMAHMIYVDAAKVITLDPPASVVTGLEHLERRNVTVLADGRVHPIRTVNDGTLYLERPASTVVVGLPYTVRLQPTKTDVPLPDGSAQGRKWKTNRATVRLHKTLGGEYADAPDREFYEMINRTVDTPLNAQQPLFSGDRELLMKSTHRGGLDITLRQRLPLPFHVLAIVPEFDVSGA